MTGRRTPIVIVSGPPASGKSTVALLLAERLGLPLLAKDRLKEVLYDSLGVGDVAWSQRLGGAALALLHHALEAQVAARRAVVVEANFTAVTARAELARLRERLPFRAIEIHCTAPPDVLLARYEARIGSRHHGHLDEQRVEEIERAIREGRNGPLDLDRTLVLDTRDWASVDLEALVDAVRVELG